MTVEELIRKYSIDGSADLESILNLLSSIDTPFDDDDRAAVTAFRHLHTRARRAKIKSVLKTMTDERELSEMLFGKDKARCAHCDEPGTAFGEILQIETINGKPREKRLQLWLCRGCFLENEFGLWAFECSEHCAMMRSLETDIRLDKKDCYVWLQMETTMSTKRRQKPKCPWCGSKLTAVQTKKEG